MAPRSSTSSSSHNAAHFARFLEEETSGTLRVVFSSRASSLEERPVRGAVMENEVPETPRSDSGSGGRLRTSRSRRVGRKAMAPRARGRRWRCPPYARRFPSVRPLPLGAAQLGRPHLSREEGCPRGGGHPAPTDAPGSLPRPAHEGIYEPQRIPPAPRPQLSWRARVWIPGAGFCLSDRHSRTSPSSARRTRRC